MEKDFESKLQTIAKIIEDVTGTSADKIKAESAFLDDLDLSSLEVLSIVAEIEKEYSVKISEQELLSIRTVKELAEAIR